MNDPPEPIEKPVGLWLAEFHLLLSAIGWLVTTGFVGLGMITFLSHPEAPSSGGSVVKMAGMLLCPLSMMVLWLVAPIMSMRRARSARGLMIGVQALGAVGGVLLAVALVIGSWLDTQQHSGSMANAAILTMSWLGAVVLVLASIPGMFFAPYLALSKGVRAWYDARPS